MGLRAASVGKHHPAVKNAWMLGAVGGFAAEFVIIRRAKEKLRRLQHGADSPLICAFICLTVGGDWEKKQPRYRFPNEAAFSFCAADAAEASQKVFYCSPPTASRRAARRLLCDQGRPATTVEFWPGGGGRGKTKPQQRDSPPRKHFELASCFPPFFCFGSVIIPIL